MTDPLANLFEALADGTRRSVLVALAHGGSATATQLAGAFPVTRQAVAKHLQVLLDAGLVAAERRGRETVFAYVPGSLQGLTGWVDEVDGGAQSAAWNDSVAALQRHLDEQRRRRGLAPSPGPAVAPGPLRIAASARPPRAPGPRA